MKIILKYFAIIFIVSTYCAFGQNTAWIDTVQSGPKQMVQFSLKVENTQPFVAFQFDIALPNVLSYVTGSAQLTPRANGHQFFVTLLNPNTLRFIAYSLTLNPFLGNNGSILTFNAISGSQPGTFNIQIVSSVLGDSLQNNIITSSHQGLFVLLAPDIKINVDTLNFGSTPLGQSSDQTLIITNQGNQSLSIINLQSTNAEIFFLDTTQTVIGVGGSINRTVRFQPLLKGNKTGSLRIMSNDPDDTLIIIRTTAHAYAVNEIRVGSTFARSGNYATLRIKINNMEPFVGFQFTLSLPPEMKYVLGSQQLLSRKIDHLISADTLINNQLRVISFSPTNRSFLGNDGDILELTFQVVGTGGFYSIPIEGPMIGDSMGTNIISASYGGMLEIIAPRIHLESNNINFGNVSIFDTALAILMISNLGSDTLTINAVTGSDENFWYENQVPFSITPSESTQLNLRFYNSVKGSYNKRFKIFHNDVERNPSYIDLTASTFISNRLEVISTMGPQYTIIPLSFGIENNEQFVGFQFDVELPTQIIYQPGTIQLSNRAQGHSIMANVLPNGDVRVLAYSLTQSPFLGDSGEVARFNINLSANSGIYPIILKNVIIGNAANQNIASGFDNGTVRIIGLPSPPILNSPANGVSNQPTTLTLNWDIVPDAETYRLQVSTDSVFSIITLDDSSLVINSQQISSLLNFTKYYWRVRAKNIVGISEWSNTWSFKIIIQLPEQTTLISPADSTVLGSDSTVFLWNQTHPEVEKYWFELSQDSLFINSYIDSTLTDTIHIQSQLENNKRYWWKVKAWNQAGWGLFSQVRFFNVIITSVQDDNILPKEYTILQNYPNPFNPVTAIIYQLPYNSKVTLGIYDILGQEIKILVDEIQEHGYKQIEWNSLNNNGLIVASGVYFYRMEAISIADQCKSFTQVRKMILLR